MGSKKLSMIGLLFYLSMILLLFQLNIEILLRPLTFLSVIGGMVILTLSQYKRGWKWSDLLLKLKQNAFMAGALSSVLMVLGSQEMSLRSFSTHLLPSVYGTLIYLCLDFLEKSETRETISQSATPSIPEDWQSPGYLMPYLISQGLSQRECHVVMKLIGGDSNKDIAAQLFIAEATVKKHLQSIYKKLEVNNRQDLIRKLLTAIWGTDNLNA